MAAAVVVTVFVVGTILILDDHQRYQAPDRATNDKPPRLTCVKKGNEHQDLRRRFRGGGLRFGFQGSQSLGFIGAAGCEV